MLLNETKMDNLLVQACRLYTECEILITELQQLTHIILMLYQDLSAGKMDTLDNDL